MTGIEERDDERKDDRPEDREDETDRAIKLAREHAVFSVQYLISVMMSDQVSNEYRIKAATVLLEVSGCL